ncbi:MAG: hypothetical protein ABIQ52_21280 [Vicinamibacterales bacterium]
MHKSSARWTGALAAAALIALPIAASAQTAPPTSTPSQPQPTTQTQPAQDPPTASTAPQASPVAAVDPAAAKQHLSEARDTLSQLTALPEAAKLQGDARTQVAQLIANFNELITTQSEWRSAYAKLDANLVSLIGPDSPDPAQSTAASGVSGAVGTSGTMAGAAATAGTAGSSATAQLDPAIRTKLMEFRTNLKAFERAAGANATTPAPAAPAAGSTTSSATMAPSAATGSSNPAASAADPAAPGSAGAASVMPNSPTAGMSQADRSTAAAQVSHADADKQLDAISAILNQSKTGTLTKAQTDALKKHVADLRQLLQQSK